MAVPVNASIKSLRLTPTTAWLKVIVKVTLPALVAGPAGLVRLIDRTKGAMPDELTALTTALPVMAALPASVAVTVCLPGVFKVVLKIPTPLVSVELAGSIA